MSRPKGSLHLGFVFIAALMLLGCTQYRPVPPQLNVWNIDNGYQADHPVVFLGQPAVRVSISGSVVNGATNISWNLSGPGQFQDSDGKPIAVASQEVMYLPPIIGTTVKQAQITASFIGNDGAFYAPSLLLSLSVPADPVDLFAFSLLYPVSPPGQQQTVGVGADPMPAVPDFSWTLESLDSPGSDPGTLVPDTRASDPYSQFSSTYTAPARIDVQRQVLITFEMLDPWRAETRTATWTITLQP